MPKNEEKLLEYVYHPEDNPEDFRQVRIIINTNISANNLYVTLEPEVDMTEKDVENVLKYLEKACLKRMDICLWEDCKVIVKNGDDRYSVSLAKDINVTGLTKI
ncbi:MAG: hypothetical protein FWC91_11055 [Defluviitaleaceae bacterium]|nr:hypothetical protein [Defluviitaleaceae bacterium]